MRALFRSSAETLANNLRGLREARGLSQKALATMAGLSIHQVGNLERGEKSPTLRTVDALAQALNVEPWQLISPRPQA